jgi:hypothetical protein
MILFKLLKSNDFYGCTENIEIAKGKYKMPETLKEGYEQIKRSIKWQTRIKN